MARQPRFLLPGHPQHIIQRGNNRSILFAEDEDYSFYLEALQQACSQQGCLLHAYVLMTNHVHLLLTPATDTGISKTLQSIGRKYVQYFNYRYRRTGTLWEGRYKAALIDSETYLLCCYRYIELNPVRAGMVAQSHDYRWSSYGHNACGDSNSLIQPHPIYLALGATDEQRQAAYRGLFKNALTQHTLDTLRESTQKSWVFGSDRFKQEVEQLTQRQLSSKQRGGDKRSAQYKKEKEATNRV